MKPYVPESLPLAHLDWNPLIRLVGTANAALARYDGILHGIINPAVLLSPLTTQEAVLSSRIEGTQATLGEVLEYQAVDEETAADKPADIREILNYRRAMSVAIEEMRTRPLSLNLMLRMHEILMDSVRGRDKGRGRFRAVQNWIGRPGCSQQEATYVPPEPIRLMEHLSNLEKYIHFDEQDPLVQLAIVHAQLEMIHPFLDGNGRVGRMLIPLFLFERGLLSSPMFYLSAYLEAYRDEYYDRLNAISAQGEWAPWIIFFLTAIVEQAKSNSDKASQILALYEQMKRHMAELTRSQFAIQALDSIFDQPVFRSTDFIRRSGIPKPSASRILAALQQDGILRLVREARGRRPAVLEFTALVRIADSR